jgi:hypothetical protein
MAPVLSVDSAGMTPPPTLPPWVITAPGDPASVGMNPAS